jgi:hypothetical protein
MSPVVPHDQQSIEQAKRDCRHDEHIHRSDPVSVVAEERPPALGRRVSSPDHVLGHARLSDIDAELEKFSMDPRRSPQRIGNAHLADKLAYLQRNCWPATPRFRFPSPIQTEAGAMPFDHGLRLNYCQRIANAREKPIKANKNQAVDGAEGLFLGSGSPQNVICCRNVRISTSSAVRDRNRSATIQTMSLTRSLIRQEHRPILDQPLVRLSLR